MATTIADNLHVINQIVDVGLCVRCGACGPACPVDIIKFDEKAYPYITDEEQCIKSCTRCLKVCPGGEVDFDGLDDETFGTRPHPQSITGIARAAYVAFSTNDAVRAGGTSGGFVTGILLYMLENRLIDGALVLGSFQDGGAWRTRPVIARTPEEVKLAAKSKYTVVPFLETLQEVEWGEEGNYAVVALPCYVHALRKYQKVSPRLRRRIKLVIGLYCNVTLEPHLYNDLCEFNSISEEDVASFDFRGGTWPGGVVAEKRDGTEQKILKLEEMKDEFNLLKLFYTPPRCNMCIDFSAEYADVAVGDPWLRGRDGQYLFPDGRTTVLVRTDIGEKILGMAVADGHICAERIPLRTYMMNFEKSASFKRDFVPKNIRLRKLLNLAVPEYRRAAAGGKATTWVSVIIRDIILLFGRVKLFRRLCLFLAQTRPAIAWFAWNRKRKARKFSSTYSKLERFVEAFLRVGATDGEKLSEFPRGNAEPERLSVVGEAHYPAKRQTS